MGWRDSWLFTNTPLGFVNAGQDEAPEKDPNYQPPKTQAEIDAENKKKQTSYLESWMKKGEEEAGTLVDKKQLAADYAMQGQKLKNLSEKGLGAAEAAPIESQFRQNQLALRAAMGSQGIRGGMGAMALATQARQAQAGKAVMSQQLQQANMEAYSGHVQQGLSMAYGLPLAYGQLGTAMATGQKLQDIQANIPTY